MVNRLWVTLQGPVDLAHVMPLFEDAYLQVSNSEHDQVYMTYDAALSSRSTVCNAGMCC